MSPAPIALKSSLLTVQVAMVCLFVACAEVHDRRDSSCPDAGVEPVGSPSACEVDPSRGLCLGCICYTADTGGSSGYCLLPLPPDYDCEGTFRPELCLIGVGCARGGLCADLRPFPDGGVVGGLCVRENVCMHARRVGSLLRCYYEDGSPYDTGIRRDAECLADEAGLLCGTGCGLCPTGTTCVGASERSGLGLCVQCASEEGDFGVPSHCGAGGSCASSDACLGFVPPSDVTSPDFEYLWHVCVPARLCELIADRHPERFTCVDG